MALVLNGNGTVGTRKKPDGITFGATNSTAMTTDVHFEFAQAGWASDFWNSSGTINSAYTQFQGTTIGGKLQYRDTSNAIVGSKFYGSTEINTNYNPGGYFNYRTGWFTCPVTGYYLVSMGHGSANNGSSYCATYCWKNSNTILMNRWEYEQSSSEFGADCAIVVKLQKYDTVHWTYHNSYLQPNVFRCGITLLGEE